MSEADMKSKATQLAGLKTLKKAKADKTVYNYHRILDVNKNGKSWHNSENVPKNIWFFVFSCVTNYKRDEV